MDVFFCIVGAVLALSCLIPLMLSCTTWGAGGYGSNRLGHLFAATAGLFVTGQMFFVAAFILAD